MKKTIFCLLAALLLCFAVPQAAYASDEDVDIDIPIGCEEHEYGSWSSKGNGTHSRYCIYCHSAQTQNCAWDGGTVTKTATCKEAGQKVFNCTVCRGTKTETLPKSTDHTPKDTWYTDKNGHSKQCAVCNVTLESGAHEPSADSSSCGVCGYTLSTGGGHTHNYASAWTTNETGHWHTCSGCTEKSSYAAHSFENACDTDCATCGYTRTVKHSPESNWSTDKNGHWKLCSVCGKKCDEAAHTPGEAATTTTAQVCMVCSFELAPVIEETPTEETQPITEETTVVTETTEETTEETEPTQEQAPFEDTPAEEFDPSWLLFVVLVLSVVALIALVVVTLRRR